MLSEWLIERGFVVTYEVKERKSIAPLIEPAASCGIYFLHFANEEYYVGLAKNVVKRYVQHRRTHNDIVRLSFKPVAREHLKRVESEDIEFFKSRVRLRNIDEMEDLIMERDFDKLVAPDFAHWFLNDFDYTDDSGEKYQNEELQTNYKYRRNFQLLAQQNFYPDLLAISRLYVQFCIPAPVKTEYAFWSVTCFEVKEEAIVIRLNIFQQEVFTVYLITLTNGKQTLEYVFQLAKSPLLEIHEGRTGQAAIQRRCRSAVFSDHYYPTGGKDQMRLGVLAKDMGDLLLISAFVKAVRLHNLRLMRKGTNMNRVSHCMDLAQELLKHNNTNSSSVNTQC